MSGRGGLTGRYQAPRMRELNVFTSGTPLLYPARRVPVALGLFVLGAAVAGGLGLDDVLGAGTYGLVLAIAVALAVILVPQPRPAFLSLERIAAGDVAAGSWVRHRGAALQVLNSHVRMPDVAGDPTPPVVVLRFSDNSLWQFRPHDVIDVVQPVDTRWRSAGGVPVATAGGGRGLRPRRGPLDLRAGSRREHHRRR